MQPEVEANFYSQDDRGRATGSGLADIDAGLRLRYEIDRKFAPYIGVAYAGKFGETASMVRRLGESARSTRFTFGLKAWF